MPPPDVLPPAATSSGSLSAPRRAGASSRVALATCRSLPDLDPDDRHLVASLAERGVTAVPAVWDDAGIDWSEFELTVLRSTWDYAPRRDEFVRWAATVPRLLNELPVVEWNTDKRYLTTLAAKGVPVIDTRWVYPDQAGWELPEYGEWVVKPAVSAGSRDSGRYLGHDGEHRALARDLVARLRAGGRVVMVQPYLPAVDSEGETAMLFFDGEYSHAIRKGPMLRGPDGLEEKFGTAGLYKEERIQPRTPRPAELEVAEAALAALPMFAERLLYARVDVIPAADGTPTVVEVELTEPSLFLGFADKAAARFAEAIVARL